MQFRIVVWLTGAFFALSAFPSAAASEDDCRSAQVVFDHLGINGDRWYSISLNEGETLAVCITNTYPPEFSYEIAGVRTSIPADEPTAAGEVEKKDLVSKRLTFVHNDQFGGYVVRVRATDAAERTEVTVGSAEKTPLNDVTLVIGVETRKWAVAFAGAFLGSGLTHPVYAIATEKTDATETKLVVRDESKEDDLALGLGAFIHLYHQKRPWLALTFGLGVSETSKTSYYIGPSFRFNDQAALTAGYGWGPIASLPPGQVLNQPPIGENVLTNLGTRTTGRVFVALSYSFLGGKAKNFLDKPFAGAPGAPGGSQPGKKDEVEKKPKPSPSSEDCDPKVDHDKDGKVAELDPDDCQRKQ